MAADSVRTTSLGEETALSRIDRFGIWLSSRKMRAAFGRVEGKRFADLGCGFQAQTSRDVIRRVAETTLVDLSISDEWKGLPSVRVIEGRLPGVMAQLESGSFDLVACSSVLEHVVEDAELLREIRRVLAPGGVCFINVPSWLGKRFLEFSAFRLRTSPMLEMDDHKTYYDVKDLWPRLVAAGFLPHNIICKRHKAGLNTYAVCRLDG